MREDCDPNFTENVHVCIVKILKYTDLASDFLNLW